VREAHGMADEGHIRRAFYEFHVSTKSPLAAWVLAKVGELYAIEADIRSQSAEHRRRIRQERSRPIVEALHAWLQDHVGRVSAVSDLAKAIRYAIRHWPGLTVFLEDGRVEMVTNVVERAIRPNTLTRKNALFAGNDGGARHWAMAMTLIQTAKLNGINPTAYLADVLERVVSGRTKQTDLHTLLPWNWVPSTPATITSHAA
jgi:transposase